MRQGVGKVRHLQVKQLWLQENVANGEIVMRKIARAINCADALTHPWGSGDNEFWDAMGLIYLPRAHSESASVRPSATYALMRPQKCYSAQYNSCIPAEFPAVCTNPNRVFSHPPHWARTDTVCSSFSPVRRSPPITEEGHPRNPSFSRVSLGTFAGTALVRRLPGLPRADFGAGHHWSPAANHCAGAAGRRRLYWLN